MAPVDAPFNELYDDDGILRWVTVTMYATAWHAVRHVIRTRCETYPDYFTDYDMLTDGRMPLSVYRTFIADTKRVWMHPVEDDNDSEGPRWSECEPLKDGQAVHVDAYMCHQYWLVPE